MRVGERHKGLGVLIPTAERDLKVQLGSHSQISRRILEMDTEIEGRKAVCRIMAIPVPLVIPGVNLIVIRFVLIGLRIGREDRVSRAVQKSLEHLRRDRIKNRAARHIEGTRQR